MPYIGRDLRTGAFRQLDDISSGFDGSDTTHTMQVNSTNVSVGDVNQILLSLGGVIQKPGTDFTVSGSTLTFTTAPAANTSFFAILLGSDNGGTTTPTDLSVNTAKIVDANVTTAKITDANITKAKLADSIDIFAGTSLSAADLGAGVHIKTGDSGGSAQSTADELVIEGSGDMGIQLLGGSSSDCGICFGDAADPNVGLLTYNHTSNYMRIKTNAAEAMRIHDNGNVGIGNTGGDYRLKVESNADNSYAFNLINSHGSQPYGQFIRYSAAAPDGSGYNFFFCGDTTANRLFIRSDGDVINHDNSYGQISDERIKQDIRDSNSQWDDIKAVKVRNFKRKDDVRQYGDSAWEQIGVVAQELETAGMDKLVKESDPSSGDILSDSSFGTLYTADDSETQDAVLYTADDKEVIDGNKNVGDIKTPSTKQIGDVKEIKAQVKSVKYSILYMKAIKALQEAMAKIETLEADVKTLKGE